MSNGLRSLFLGLIFFLGLQQIEARCFWALKARHPDEAIAILKRTGLEDETAQSAADFLRKNSRGFRKGRNTIKHASTYERFREAGIPHEEALEAAPLSFPAEYIELRKAGATHADFKGVLKAPFYPLNTSLKQYSKLRKKGITHEEALEIMKVAFNNGHFEQVYFKNYLVLRDEKTSHTDAIDVVSSTHYAADYLKVLAVEKDHVLTLSLVKQLSIKPHYEGALPGTRVKTYLKLRETLSKDEALPILEDYIATPYLNYISVGDSSQDAISAAKLAKRAINTGTYNHEKDPYIKLRSKNVLPDYARDVVTKGYSTEKYLNLVRAEKTQVEHEEALFVISKGYNIDIYLKLRRDNLSHDDAIKRLAF